MPSLVLELQRDALDKTVKTSDLLRKALVVARKLKVMDIEQWISNELNGYSGGPDLLPDYRTLRGEPKAFNPYHGWIPLIMSDAKQAEMLSKSPNFQPIAELENLGGSEGGMVYVKFPKGVEMDLMRGMEFPLETALILSRNQIHGILDRVRNTILDWALGLEYKGITGDGMSFTPEEQKQAGSVTYNVGSLGAIIGAMHDSQLQQGTTGSTQIYTKTLDLEAVRGIVEELKARIDEAKLEGDDRVQINSDLACIDSQLAAPKPNVEVVRECLRSTRSILEGVAGSALFQGIITAIGALT